MHLFDAVDTLESGGRARVADASENAKSNLAPVVRNRWKALAGESGDCHVVDADDGVAGLRCATHTAENRCATLQRDAPRCGIRRPNHAVRTTPVRKTLPVFSPSGTDTRAASRVDAERLDTLMTLDRRARDCARTLQESRDNRQRNRVGIVMLMHRGSSEVSRTRSRRSRMVPVGQAFERFERMVRDTAHELASRWRSSSGNGHRSGQIGARRDRRSRHASAEKRARSRNRTPAERRVPGKPPVAKLVLSASRERSSVVIQVSDDGRGIDMKKVLERRARGRISSSPTQESLMRRRDPRA